MMQRVTRHVRATIVGELRPEYLRDASDAQLADEADDLLFGKRDAGAGEYLRKSGMTKGAIVSVLLDEREALRGAHFRPVQDLFR